MQTIKNMDESTKQQFGSMVFKNVYYIAYDGEWFTKEMTHNT
jgi:hypothetical protein